MAMTKPLLLNIPAFDVANGYTFKFTVQGGNQVTANRLIIKNNETGAIVYNQLQETFKLEHVVPPNAPNLTNGTYYIAQVQTQDAQGATSPLSNTIQFYCYTTPTIAWSNPPIGSLIENSSYNFEFTYNQREAELLNYYIVNLYDSTGALASTSKEKYVGSITPPPTSLSHYISGFEDSSTYFIECIGTTLNGTAITTGRIRFDVKYVQPNVFAIVDLTNNCEGGYINIKSNIALIEGESNPDPPVYIDNKEVDLTGDDWWVKWRSGYEINGDMTLRIWVKNSEIDKPIDIIWNKDDTPTEPNRMEITFKNGIKYGETDIKRYAQIEIYNGTTIPQYNFSNFIPIPQINEQVFIWLRRINDIYEIKIENLGVIV